MGLISVPADTQCCPIGVGIRHEKVVLTHPYFVCIPSSMQTKPLSALRSSAS